MVQQPTAAVYFILRPLHFSLRESVERAKQPSIDNPELGRGHLEKSPALQCDASHRKSPFLPIRIFFEGLSVADWSAITIRPSKSTCAKCAHKRIGIRERVGPNFISAV
jgi:hypothetical protein